MTKEYTSLVNTQSVIGKAALRQMLDVIMCSDDMDVPELIDFAEAESRKLGFSDWVDAYHNL